MNFVSAAFLAWVLLFVVVSRVWDNKYTPYLLTLSGLGFIFYSAPVAGMVLIPESLLCYYVVRRKNKTGVISLLTISVVFSAFLLFKYLVSLKSLILPLGISYFTFRLIHYVQESYRGRIRQHTLTEFLAYMTFFPTYLTGPINLFPEFLANLRRRRWDYSQFSSGLERLIYGFAQLVILGNYLVNQLIREWMMSGNSLTDGFAGLTIQSVYMWLDLYIRFSAYSSIAIGIAAIGGFSVPENFNYPFLAQDIREFWHRWHMSLTQWCREYIFTPLAAITRKPFFAVGATMVTIGIWHELSMRYVLWGLYHAAGIAVFEKYTLLTRGKFPENKPFRIIRKSVGIVITLAFVILSFPVTFTMNNFLISLLR